ncbi:MAG: ABC transporter permease, partial [Parvibaculaceae bacterium]
GWGGVIIAQTLSFLPAAFIVLDNVLAKQEGRLEDAAAILGADSWQTFRRLTLPMSQPALIKAFVVVFVMSMTDFANPLTVGRGMPVLAGILYDEMIGFHNTRLSAALAVWLITPAIILYLLIGMIGRRKRYDSGGTNAGRSELPLPAFARIVLTVTAYAILALVAIVYVSVVVGSFVRMWGVDYSLTLDWYLPAGAASGFVSGYRGLDSVWFSFKVAALAAPLGGLLAAIIAYLAERTWMPGRNAIGLMTLLPAAIPGVIFGVGYIVAFNLPFGMQELSFTGTTTILVVNILFANLFVGVLAGRATLQRLDASIDEAAEILGASIAQRFAKVVLPMMWHSALLGALYIFVHGMTTLSAVIFLISPHSRLASYAIFDSVLNAYYGVACAMSAAILAIVFATMAAMRLFERHGPAWVRLGAEASGRG